MSQSKLNLLSPFSVPDHPWECDSHRGCDDRRSAQISPPGDGRPESLPVPKIKREEVQSPYKAHIWLAPLTTVYLVVIEGIHQSYEPPGLGFFVQREQWNVTNKDGVKQSAYLQVVTGP